MLITLTIIGIIAAITIPTLMKNMQEHAWHQQWKDDYSMLNNAYKMVVAEEPDIVVSAANSYGMTLEFIDTFLSKLKVVETCEVHNVQNSIECDNYDNRDINKIKYKWSGIANYSHHYKTLAGGTITSYDFENKAALLKNGASIYLGGVWSGLTIVVDVNNYTKGPNVLGKDVYALNLVEINYPARQAYVQYRMEINVKDLMIQPYGTSNKQDGEGLKGCAANIGNISSSALYGAAGAGCSYKYLYEK